MKSKKDKVVWLFMSQPTKHWHFNEIIKKGRISKPQALYWLDQLKKQHIIKHIKPKNRHPYFIADWESSSYHNYKKIFGLSELRKSGLLDHLLSLEKAKVVYLFGSFSRSDWYEDSDIDIFIFGEASDFEQGKFEVKLNKEIQLHIAKNKKELRKINKMLPYILEGERIKGNINDLGVSVNA